MEMVGFILFIIGCITFIFFGFIFTKRKTKGKPKRTKFIVRGTTMIVLSPFIALVVGVILDFPLQGGGWMAVISLLYVTPILFLVGLILLLIGIFTKKETSVEV